MSNLDEMFPEETRRMTRQMTKKTTLQRESIEETPKKKKKQEKDEEEEYPELLDEEEEVIEIKETQEDEEEEEEVKERQITNRHPQKPVSSSQECPQESSTEKINPKEKNHKKKNVLGLDLGASKSVSSTKKGKKGNVNTKNPLSSLFIVNFSTNPEVITLKNLPKLHSQLKDQELMNIPFHLKLKLAFYNKKVFPVHKGNEVFEIEISKILQRVITFYIDDQKIKIDDYDTFLISCPNSYSYFEVCLYKNLVKEALWNTYKWNGEVFSYYEAECALAYVFTKKDRVDGNYLIVEQGDSTTNLTLAIVKNAKKKDEKIEFFNKGITKGGNELTTKAFNFVKEERRNQGIKTSDEHLEKMRYIEIPQLKEDMLNEEENYEFDGVSIDCKKFHKRCEAFYKEIDDEIKKLLSEHNIKVSDIKYIFTGGGMENNRQTEYLRKNIFKFSTDFYTESCKNQVVEGLHYRHAMDPSKITEKSPYNIYTAIRNQNKSINLIKVLAYGKTEFTYPESITVIGSSQNCYFRLFQIIQETDSKDQIIQDLKDLNHIIYEHKLGKVKLIEIGKIDFEKNEKKQKRPRKFDIKLGGKWKNHDIQFYVYHGKDFEVKEVMEFSLEKSKNTNLTFENLQKEEK